MSNLQLHIVKTSNKLEKVRDQVREFIAEERRNGVFEPQCDSWLSGYSPEFTQKLGERGWIGMTWPKEYGGHERSSIERYIVTEELLAAGAPVAAHWIADRQHGPLILRYGTEQQKKFFLPKIAKGECFSAIGLSEPNAGSDLASIKTKAEKTDGGWTLNGSKIWTSNAHRAHYLIALCRTSSPNPDKRHDGMSQFMIDLTAEGVTVRPILLMNGEHHFNEVFFDNVFVPDDMVVGKIGNGWQQGMAELAYERSGPERFLSTFPLLEELVSRIWESDNKDVLARVTPLISRLWTLRNMSQGIAHMLEHGETPNTAAALVKNMGTRFEQDVIEVARLYAKCLPTDESASRFENLIAESLLHSPGFTLRGGTTEILRGIVAKGVIGS